MFFGLPEYHLAQELARLIDRDRKPREETHTAKATQRTASITDNRREHQPDPCPPAAQPGRPAVSNL